jgi:hypothetical protein
MQYHGVINIPRHPVAIKLLAAAGVVMSITIPLMIMMGLFV